MTGCPAIEVLAIEVLAEVPCMALQVCDSDFFLQTLPLLRESPDVALVRPACPAMPHRRSCTGGSPCWTPAEPCFARISLHF